MSQKYSGDNDDKTAESSTMWREILTENAQVLSDHVCVSLRNYYINVRSPTRDDTVVTGGCAQAGAHVSSRE